MPKSLQEYADWLTTRDLLWPAAPEVQPVKAKPSVKRMAGIRGVVWDLYGTLLTISEGRLLQRHPQQLAMQIALDKTIKEFQMWNSMTRKPGAPWEYMLHKYDELVERLSMSGTANRNESPEINSTVIWRTIIERLQQKDYQFDAGFYGDLDDFCEKVAFFFHACLQGVGVMPGAVKTLSAVAASGRTQGLLCDGQSFSIVQMLRAFAAEGKMPRPAALFDPRCFTLSYRLERRKPSKVLYQSCLKQYERQGITAKEILYVGSRLREDLAVAKKMGMRTALFAGDRSSLEASAGDLRDSSTKPDRLLAKLEDIRSVLGI